MGDTVVIFIAAESLALQFVMSKLLNGYNEKCVYFLSSQKNLQFLVR